MDNLVLKFVSAARGAGLRISTSEVLDCLCQIKQINTVDELQFATTLRANFVKTHRDFEKFDHLYHLFFHEMREQGGETHLDTISDQIEDLLDALKKSNDQNRITDAVLEFLSGDPLSYLEEMRRIESEGEGKNQGFNSNLGGLTRRLEIKLLLDSVRGGVSEFLSDNINRIKWEIRQELLSYFNGRLDIAEKLLVKDPKPKVDRKKRKIASNQHLNKFGEQSFFSLTPKEVEEMRQVIAELVRKLKDTRNRRYAKKNRGILDVKKTLRRSAKYQGVPIEIKYRKKPPRKTEIVVLCDVSSSVWGSAKFMLNMLYSFKECFIKVRSFIFVAGLDEVTEIFDKYEVNQAIDKVLKEADINYNAATDYGETFRHFKTDYMDILKKKTTLIIIGDGRSNYRNPEEAIFDEMREKSRRVIWLNPESDRFWNSGDSEMRAYEGYCHEVRECQNLNQLVDFINGLVL